MNWLYNYIHRVSLIGLSCVCGGFAAMYAKLLYGTPLCFAWGVSCWMMVTCIVGGSVLLAHAFAGKESNG